MRPRKIFGLLIPLLQLLLILKLIELIQGHSLSSSVTYVTSVPYTNSGSAGSGNKGRAVESSAGWEFEGRKKKKHYIPYWSSSSSTTEEPENQTAIIIKEVIEYDQNGTEVERKNVTSWKKVKKTKGGALNQPLCPEQLQETSRGQRQQQIVRQSTLPMLILFINVGVWIVGLVVFLLLWKVNYYTVNDPWATGLPEEVPVQRSLDSYENSNHTAIVGNRTTKNPKPTVFNKLPDPKNDFLQSLIQVFLEKLDRAMVL